MSLLMDEEGLDELELSDGKSHVKLVRQSKGQPALPVNRPSRDSSQEPKEGQAESESGTPVKSPLAGVFYSAPSPKSPPLVKEGDKVSSGQPLCIIEAMKVMNEIISPTRGRITRVLVENGKPVSADQTLFIIGPES